MDKKTWEARKRQWEKYQEWESHSSPSFVVNPLGLVGQWVDFFLSRYPPSADDAPSVEGIRKMHQALSHIAA